MGDFQIKSVTESDKADWQALFEGYADFYRVVINDDIADTVWGWLNDPDHVLEGFVARNASGVAVGIAHVRACPRTLAGADIGFLDDLFVHPSARGSGAADALFAALESYAHSRGWAAIRWITQHYNERGRAFYDRYTRGPSDFIMYQWTQ